MQGETSLARRALGAATALSLAAAASPAFAQAAQSQISPADTTWMIVASALVLMMTIPGLSLLYSGMVRRKNVLSTMAQCLACVALCSLLWYSVGYSLTFAAERTWIGNWLAGSLRHSFMGAASLYETSAFAPQIPEFLFMLHHMTVAIFATALLVGSVVGRMRFSVFVWFAAGWLIFCYVPVARVVWGDGFLAGAGTLDFAGGTVVQLNAGVAGLVAAWLLGRRYGYGTDHFVPYNLSLTVIGLGLLWVGWFGLVGGAAYGANPRSILALLATQLAASSGALTWMVVEWLTRGKPSVLGIVSGAVAGLAAITPAAGFVEPWHAMVIGIVAGCLCYWACTALKSRLGYDDPADVFGIHGVGGAAGTVLTGVFAVAAISAGPDRAGFPGLIEGNYGQVVVQLYAVGAVTLWSGAVSFFLLKVIGSFVPLRVEQQDELEGLDITQHGETLHLS